VAVAVHIVCVSENWKWQSVSNKIWNGIVAVDLTNVISIVLQYLLSQIYSLYLNKNSTFCAIRALESIFELLLRVAWSMCYELHAVLGL
jgi:hypothetical protein